MELKVKLEDVVHMVVAYGEYLAPNDRDGYIDIFLEHVIRAAKGFVLRISHLIMSSQILLSSH